MSQAQGTHWNVIRCKECLGNCPEAVIRQAIINLDSRVWKSLEDSLPNLYLVDLPEAYVTQESESWGFLWVRKAMICDRPTDVCMRNLRGKAEWGEKMVLILVPGSCERLASRKCVMCARTMGAHIRHTSTSESQRYEKTGWEIGFPCSQKRCKETSK